MLDTSSDAIFFPMYIFIDLYGESFFFVKFGSVMLVCLLQIELREAHGCMILDVVHKASFSGVEKIKDAMGWSVN